MGAAVGQQAGNGRYYVFAAAARVGDLKNSCQS